MGTLDIPLFGTLALAAMLVATGYTFGVAVLAGRGRPQLLPAARSGAYATAALVLVGVCVLAYAFQTHDFRIRYVARYSDRSMEWWYLIASLWGGQDGSLLWWSFLLAGWTVACVAWMRGRYAELQPWVIATLMTILAFFLVVMLFAANPFSVTHAAVPADGEGLNPLLQNYWMMIHPPTLYMGFVGWSVPFAFVVAALVTGRLHDEWLHAVRRWVLAAWLFLAVGLLLGMVWSYEELGWGGYWAWDPVENASFMPWLVGTAFVHSTMVQERYGMLRVWNAFLMCLTFFMTIFGTFLTRSGLIASVHSFARSDLGVYFAWYLGFLLVACTALIVWRLPKLKAQHQIESLLSREFAFLLNNWILLAMMGFVLVATTFPLLSEWLRGQEVTVGPPFYNKWMVPLGFVLLFLTGYGPLVSWRKATGKNLRRAFALPLLIGALAAVTHAVFGAAAGLPPTIEADLIYDTATGQVLAAIFKVAPLISSFVCAFVVGAIGQEYWRGVSVRMRSKGEAPWTALVQLVSRARRRYGGYLVHLSIVLLYVGFTGAAYDQEVEATVRPGESLSVGNYRLRYDQPRMESDPNKRMIFADLTVFDRNDREIATVSPAKFIYTTHPEMPTTEVAIESRLTEDLYVIMSTVDSQTKVGTFRAIVRPLVPIIWLGGLLLIMGTMVAGAPTVREILGATTVAGRPSVGSGRLAAAAAALLLAFAVVAWFASPARAQGGSSSLHAGTVMMKDPAERQLFNRLLCMCGDCERLPLATCGCGWAEEKRAEIRVRVAAGVDQAEIQETYRERYGGKALSIPADRGLDRALWAVPVGAIVLAAGGVWFVGRRWKRRGTSQVASHEGAVVDATASAQGDYESRLAQALSDEEDR